MKVVRYQAVALSTLLSMAPQAASAWNGVKSGKITRIDVSDGQNLGFRIYMDGTSMCGTQEVFAYMNSTWENYDAAVALLTSTYLRGGNIVVHTTKVGQYCQIGYIAFT